MRKKYFKEDILQKGQDLVREQGYHNTGINDILKVCGIPKGSFYNFFSSKEDFALQIIDLYGKQSADLFTSHLNNTNHPPLQRIKSLYEALIHTHKGEHYRNGCLISNLAFEVAGLNERMANMIDHHYQIELDIISACIQEGQDTGEITQTFTARQLAKYIHNGFHGSLLEMKSQRKAEAVHLSLNISMQILAA